MRERPRVGDMLQGGEFPGTFVTAHSPPQPQSQSQSPVEEIRRRLEAARVKLDEIKAQIRASRAK